MPLGDVTPLTAAIISAWQAAGGELSSIAGPFKDMAPTVNEKGNGPYAVYNIVAFTHQFYSCDGDYWQLLYDVSIYDKTIELLGPRVSAVGAVLDVASNIATHLTVGSLVNVERVGEMYMQEDKTVERAILSYRILWKRPRAV